jgi:pyruvate-ferredoxin/flavodoxin oxidoreductase
MGQVRYSSLEKAFPEQAEHLFKQAEMYSKEKYEIYKQIAEAKPMDNNANWSSK